MTKIFVFWRFVIAIGWAKSLLWEVTGTKDTRIFLLSLHVLKTKDGKTALGLLVGPIAITVGIII